MSKKKPSAFGPRLREHRERKALTQAAVAESLGVHLQTYMRWERGDTEPAFSQLCALAEILGVSLNDFLPADE